MPQRAAVLCVVGTRPEAIKTAPVVRALRTRGVPVHLCLTGQHPELAPEALGILGVHADSACTLVGPASPAAVAEAVAPTLARVRPALVLVHGDTTSTLGATLAARAAGVAVGHIEAGLRSHDLRAPFPEELYRRLVDRVSDLHFAPTPRAAANLRAEGIADPVPVTGNSGIDAFRRVLHELGPVELPARPLVLVTAHRRENLGTPLVRVASALQRLAEAHPEVDFVLPVHPNPAVAPALALLRHPSVRRVAPLPYPAFVDLLRQAHVVLTDSGGIQEEAPLLGKPLLVLRERTERPEGVEAGTARLVGTDPDRIVAEVGRLLTDPAHHAAMARVHAPYGDGHAAERIASLVERWLHGADRLAAAPSP